MILVEVNTTGLYKLEANFCLIEILQPKKQYSRADSSGCRPAWPACGYQDEITLPYGF